MSISADGKVLLAVEYAAKRIDAYARAADGAYPASLASLSFASSHFAEGHYPIAVFAARIDGPALVVTHVEDGPGTLRVGTSAGLSSPVTVGNGPVRLDCVQLAGASATWGCGLTNFESDYVTLFRFNGVDAPLAWHNVPVGTGFGPVDVAVFDGVDASMIAAAANASTGEIVLIAAQEDTVSSNSTIDAECLANALHMRRSFLRFRVELIEACSSGTVRAELLDIPFAFE